MKTIIAFILLIISPVALYALYDAPYLSYPDFCTEDKEIYEVLRVVDGDTIEVMYDGEKEKVRLLGVDTPETVHPFKPVEPYGKEASAYVKNLLTGEYVYIFPDKKNKVRDRYGRLLGYVLRYPDKLFVNLELVRQGYGKAYTRYPFTYKVLFVHYGDTAEKNKKGLWGMQKD